MPKQNTERFNTMEDYEEYNNSWMVVVCHILASCKTQYVPVENTHTIYQNHTDSIHLIDSVYHEKETVIREANSGDSTLLAKYGIQLKNNERMLLLLQRDYEKQLKALTEQKADTVIENDTIRVPYPVEKKVPFWEKAKLASLGAVAAISVAAAVLFIWWLRRRYKRC